MIQVAEQKTSISASDIQESLGTQRRHLSATPIIATLATPQIASADHALQESYKHGSAPGPALNEPANKSMGAKLKSSQTAVENLGQFEIRRWL
jgi:hypothetical protein